MVLTSVRPHEQHELMWDEGFKGYDSAIQSTAITLQSIQKYMYVRSKRNAPNSIQKKRQLPRDLLRFISATISS